jgi:uncharacterized protein
VMATVSARAASLGSVGHVGATSWTRLPRQLRGNQASVRRSGVGPVKTRISSTTTNACHRCVANGVLFAALGPRPRRATDHRCATAEVHNKASPKGDASTRADRTEEEGAMTTNTSEKKNQIEKPPDDDDSVPTRAALALIRFYRTQISPFTPPSCRFVPTCSGYAIESFKRFGPGKGFALTVWRILRWYAASYFPNQEASLFYLQRAV